MEIETERSEVSVADPSFGIRARLNLIAGLLGLLVIVFASQIFLNRQLPETWQYMIAAPKDTEMQAVVDRLGADGWELILARRASDGATQATMSYEMIFKKRGAAPGGIAFTPGR
jgi:hypothetical protein